MSTVVDVGGWVAPAMELIYERGTTSFRSQWPGLERRLRLSTLRRGQGDWTHPWLELPFPTAHAPRRDAWTDVTPRAPAPDEPLPGVLHDNAAGRVAALDEAGIGLQLISPGPTIDACIALPTPLAAGVLGAYNQYVLDYCEPFPDRLGAVLQVHGAEPLWSAHEVRALAVAPCVRAVSVCLPVRIAPDAAALDPLWAALEETGLPLLQRSPFSAQVWTAPRMLAYLRDGGVLERFPGLRFGFLAAAIGPLGTVEEPALSDRVFVGVHRSARDTPSPQVMWASDFPLRGRVRAGLAHTGPGGVDAALTTTPARFLGSR